MIISNIYKRAFNVLSKMPFKLWGTFTFEFTFNYTRSCIRRITDSYCACYSGSFRRYGGSLS